MSFTQPSEKRFIDLTDFIVSSERLREGVHDVNRQLVAFSEVFINRISILDSELFDYVRLCLFFQPRDYYIKLDKLKKQVRHYDIPIEISEKTRLGLSTSSVSEYTDLVWWSPSFLLFISIIVENKNISVRVVIKRLRILFRLGMLVYFSQKPANAPMT